jgi:hypothetical protein
MIKGKMWVLNRMIHSHTQWDILMEAPRGGVRHFEEIQQLWTQNAYCQGLYEEKWQGKCQEKRPWWQPSPETLRDVGESLQKMRKWLEPPLIPLPFPGEPVPVPVLAW